MTDVESLIKLNELVSKEFKAELNIYQPYDNRTLKNFSFALHSTCFAFILSYCEYVDEQVKKNEFEKLFNFLAVERKFLDIPKMEILNKLQKLIEANFSAEDGEKIKKYLVGLRVTNLILALQNENCLSETEKIEKVKRNISWYKTEILTNKFEKYYSEYFEMYGSGSNPAI
jgi:hypothetical protein